MTTSNKSPGNFSKDRDNASEASKKGGQAPRGNSAGGFSNDRQKASDAGKKGGQSHSGGRNS